MILKVVITGASSKTGESIFRLLQKNKELIIKPKQINLVAQNRFRLMTLKTETNLDIKFSKNVEDLPKYRHYYSTKNQFKYMLIK